MTLARLRRQSIGYALIAPAVVTVVVFLLIPIVLSAYWSFTEYNGVKPPTWVGLDNYATLLTSPRFQRSIWNTVVFVVLGMGLGPPLGLATALLLNRAMRFRGVFRVAFFLPVMTSLVVVATIWKMLYNENGLINEILRLFTLPGHNWLSDPNTALPSIVVASVWQGFGFETVVFVGEGQTAPVRPIGTPGNLLLKVHDFAAPQRADGSFADFSTDLSVYQDGQELARKTIRVNDPLRIDAYAFHQNTFGPVAELTIHDAAGSLVWRGPLLLDDLLLDRPQGFMTIPGAEVGLVAVLNEGADGVAQLVLQGVGPADPATGANETLFLVTIPVGVTTDPEVTAGHSIRWDGIGAWSGMVIRSDPGQPLVWLAFGLLIVGLMLTFYFPRRRAWARIEEGRIGLAFLADRYVDKDREFGQLRDEVERRTGGRAAGS